MAKKPAKMGKGCMDDAAHESSESYDEEAAELEYPGASGVAMPQRGKQQVKGFKFSGTY